MRPVAWLKARPAPAEPWAPKGPPPVIGDYVRVVMSSGDEHMRGWVFAIDPQAGEGRYFICDPTDYDDGPWIANFPGHKMEKAAGGAMPFPVPEVTEDGLKPGDAVRVYIRARDELEKAIFISEVLGRRVVRYPGAGAMDYPAQDVVPLGRARITAAQMREMRERLHVSVFEARKALEGRGLLEELHLARSLSDIKPILETLIRKQYPDPER